MSSPSVDCPTTAPAIAAQLQRSQLDLLIAQRQSARQLHAREAFRRLDTATAMSPEEVRRSQKPYRYGMILLCFGALINWVGLAENYTEPIRYAGVACIVCGALLICTAMCCWLHTPPRAVGAAGAAGEAGADDPVQVITVPEQLRTEKPPEYETCVIQPPTYDDALQLSPAALLADARKMGDMMKVPSYEAACRRPTTASSSPNDELQTVVASVPVVSVMRVATINVCRVMTSGSASPQPVTVVTSAGR